MKCQQCNEPATHHVTDLVHGGPVEYHVCERHVQDVGTLKPAPGEKVLFPCGTLWGDPHLRKAAQQKMAAYILPALCMALLDEQPEVRVVAALNLMQLGANAQSALGALRDALADQDERVRAAAKMAIEFIETGQEPPWFVI